MWIIGVIIAIVALGAWWFMGEDARAEKLTLEYLGRWPDTTAATISNGTGLGSGVLYPALFRLEHEKKIVREVKNIGICYRLAEGT